MLKNDMLARCVEKQKEKKKEGEVFPVPSTGISKPQTEDSTPSMKQRMFYLAYSISSSEGYHIRNSQLVQKTYSKLYYSKYEEKK